MLGIALEGGGSKGAYHLGVIRAYQESGYHFDGAVGTSIGAINAALVAQGDVERAYHLWENMTTQELFDIEDEQLRRFKEVKLDETTLIYLAGKIKTILADRGIDTTKIRQLLDTYIDEERLRRSPIDFGLVTVSLSDRKALELYKEDIPQGQMIDYIMASASFPGFKLQPIEGKYYLDGGFYDNCPISLLIKKGYTEIIAVRTLGEPLKRKYQPEGVHVIEILPAEPLGNTLIFDNNIIRNNLKMGYFDGLRVIRQLTGQKYYLTDTWHKTAFAHLIAVPDSVILEIAQLLSLPDWEPKKLLFEQIIPKLSDFLRLSSYKSYHDFFIALLEATAEQYQIDRFRLYDVPQFIEAIQQHQASAMKKEHALSFPFFHTTFHTTENLQQAVEKLAIALCQICSST